MGDKPASNRSCCADLIIFFILSQFFLLATTIIGKACIFETLCKELAFNAESVFIINFFNFLLIMINVYHL